MNIWKQAIGDSNQLQLIDEGDDMKEKPTKPQF